jgi:hypothetical protein
MLILFMQLFRWGMDIGGQWKDFIYFQHAIFPIVKLLLLIYIVGMVWITVQSIFNQKLIDIYTSLCAGPLLVAFGRPH